MVHKHPHAVGPYLTQLELDFAPCELPATPQPPSGVAWRRARGRARALCARSRVHGRTRAPARAGVRLGADARWRPRPRA